MDELLMLYARKHVAGQPEEYYWYTVELMKHMLGVARKQRELKR